ncbi:MAG: MBL fold metallo-hydrolase [Saprospiraceae bacterium]
MNTIKFSLATILGLLLLVLFSCGDDNESNPMVDFGTAPSLSITNGTVEVITEDMVRYHTIVFGELVTAVIVESETGVTLIDVAFSFGNFPDAGTELRAYTDAIGKPINVIITHAHQDHYGNIANFADATIYAETKNVPALLADPIFMGLFSGTVNGVSGAQEIGGIEFVFDNLSNTETSENGYVSIPAYKSVFPGDLVFNLSHAFIREYTPLDDTDELEIWITGLNKMKSDFNNYNHIFMGHNGRRTDIADVFDENIAYLTDAQGLIKGTKELTAGGFATSVQEVVDELLLLYPNHKPGGLYLALPDGFFPGDPGATWF